MYLFDLPNRALIEPMDNCDVGSSIFSGSTGIITWSGAERARKLVNEPHVLKPPRKRALTSTPSSRPARGDSLPGCLLGLLERVWNKVGEEAFTSNIVRVSKALKLFL
jgi:hypothetical protein